MRDYRTSRDRVFACGDMRRGQSLVVWAIREAANALPRSMARSLQRSSRMQLGIRTVR